MVQKWDAKTLKKMAERAYNYREDIGKDGFQSLFRFVQVLELAEAAEIPLETPQDFQNLITKIRDEYNKTQNERADKFRDTHMHPTKRADLRKLSKKDWRRYLGIFLEDCTNDDVYYPSF